MEQVNGTHETQVETEQKAIEELKDLFPSPGVTLPVSLITQIKEKEKLLFFERFQGKILLSLS